MDKKLAALYLENLVKFRNGEISKEVWYEFCANILVQAMMDNK